MTTQPSSGRVLITVSGSIPDAVQAKIEAGELPRRDYLELAQRMDGDLVDVPEARRRSGRIGAWLERIGGAGALLGWYAFRHRRRYAAVFTDGEQVGLPLALLCRLTHRRPFPHVMIVHIMSVRKKALLHRLFGLNRYVDSMVVYASAQQRFVTENLGVPSDRVLLTPFTVDTRFFTPQPVVQSDKPMLCTAGLEFRDYETLLQAVRGLDARVVVAAASPWSKRPDRIAGSDVPANVEVCQLTFVPLRQLYADAAFVVMPLFDVPFQAGVTTILEAMAMGKAVVCSRTEGQTDVVVEGETGLYVKPGDSLALRDAIEQLLVDPYRAARLGAAGRKRVVEDCDVSIYSARLADFVEAAISRHCRPASTP
jgi:glycosyltransferase involved in cell wall biosynthesis